MTKTGSEERYPLLLLYVEENGRKSEFPQRVVFTDKGRGKGVIQGAAAILTQWPAQVTSCWLTSVALGTAFIFISLIFLMSSFNPLSFPIQPRCTREVIDHHNNKTIHLVKHGSFWSHKQLDILRFIADSYPDYIIRNIMLDSSLKNFKKRERKKIPVTTSEKPYYHFHIPDFTNTFVKKLNEILKKDTIVSLEESTTETRKTEEKDTQDRQEIEKAEIEKEKIEEEEIKECQKEEKDLEQNLEKNKIPLNPNITAKRMKRCLGLFKLPTSYEELLLYYPNIIEVKTTYKSYFSTTPLHYFWVDYSPEMILFSVRVMELWQNGGISFSLPYHDHHEHDHHNIDHNNIDHQKDYQNLKDHLIPEKNMKIASKQNATSPITTKINITNTATNPKQPFVNLSKLKMVIASTKFRYEKLTDDLVSVDGQGFHMATKIPCHSFFGEMIIKLQKNYENLSVPAFIQRILNVFCGRGAVDSEYCLKTKK